MIGFRRQIATWVALAAATGCAQTISAQNPRIAVQDSFRIGDAGVLCTAQVQPLDKNLKGIFDRGYGIVCRDAASAVGHLYAVRTARDPVPAIIASDPIGLSCAQPTPVAIAGIGPATMRDCTGSDSRLKFKAYSIGRAGTAYVAEGLAGYDSALRLGLQTLVSDRSVKGAVDVATTSAGDPAAFARAQAGSLDADAALAQAYIRNNSGSFAEAAEFFETLVERDALTSGNGRASEYLINQALQQSNLGNFAAADGLFRQAAAKGAIDDPVTSRLLRNYRAMHQLNQRRPDEAIAMLDAPVPPMDRTADTALAIGVISTSLAEQINRENASLERLGGIDTRLRPSERGEILDGQASQLRGIALRLKGEYAAALAALSRSNAMLGAVRDGRVGSTAFMRSESLGEMALISEAQGDFPNAGRQFVDAGRLLEIDYPRSIAAIAAKARYAAYLARRGQAEQALALYGEVVEAGQGLPGSSAAIGTMLAPYFALLAPRVESDAKAAAAMFAASQVMVRPGVAQTQAVFARELSGGDDEAASMFRQSVTLARDVARATGEVARLAVAKQGAAEDSVEITAARARLAQLERDQTLLQSRLADYPRYRVLAPQTLLLADLQKILRPEEAYYQLRVVDEDVYAMLVTPAGVRAIKAATTATQLSQDVATLRATIVTLENGAQATYPFDLALARKLYVEMFEPFGEALAAATSLIYEPDGPMLELPANLLPMNQAGVDAYYARLKLPKSDEYDYRSVMWLGRDRDITTAVSPRSFADIRAIAPSRGQRAYLGLGHNAIPGPEIAMFRQTSADDAADCQWSIANWGNPISADELTLASATIGKDWSELVTDQAFTDTALRQRTDLTNFRILHFATHGLVTAPDPRCPARPALLTSFGGPDSDGLLTFREIYDLKLDADIVVLSACDTAGMATIEATREAGIATGGNFALDGLVRAFVGAGARTIIASHWPIPDDYDATKRLMLALFKSSPGTPVASALRSGQRALMDAAETSHPFYWSAFAIVGDGEQPLIRVGDKSAHVDGRLGGLSPASRADR